ncbi:MAG: peptidylprolyl isomerase [Acidimicrobiia bacterium]
MGKASKRERQKSNKVIKEQELAKAASRDKAFKTAKTVALILIIPLIVIIAVFINKATNADVYTAKITVAIEGETSLPNKGVIDVELDYANAPKSVKHFIGIAKDGSYNGLEWHRVVKDFVIQTGDPKGDGTGSLASTALAETPDKGYKTGDIAWAKAATEPAGTAGSQFFIITGEQSASGLKTLNTKVPQQDGTSKYEYGLIGHVTKGISVALKIEGLAPKATKENQEPDPKPIKKTIVQKIEVFKNGRPIKANDKSFPSPTTTSTTTTTTTTTTTPVTSTTKKK